MSLYSKYLRGKLVYDPALSRYPQVGSSGHQDFHSGYLEGVGLHQE